jgi:CheY-like chemotaxis protein
MVLEDNADSREMLAGLLEAYGFDVYAAADGLCGLEAALERKPEVLLIDIGLPGLDGYQVARKIRETLGADPYLIALTGYGLPEDRERALRAGFNVHFTKPVAVDSLLERLGQVSGANSKRASYPPLSART